MARKIPQRLESEKSVLGSMFLGKEPLDKACDVLTKEHFYDEANGLIFETMKKLNLEHIPIDVTTVTAELEKKNILSKVGGVEKLTELVTSVPTAVNIDYYIKDLDDAYLLRNLINVAENIRMGAFNEEELRVEDILDRSEKAILDVVKGKKTEDLKRADEIFRDVTKDIEFVIENKSDVTGLNTGFIDFDKLTTGLKGGQLIIIGARTGIGKTAFALNIANNVGLIYQKTVAFFDVEMTAKQLAKRMLSSYAHVNSKKLETGNITAEEQLRLNEGITQFEKSNIYFDDSTGITVGALKSKCRRLKSSPVGLDLIIVDYLQLISTVEKYASREQEVSSISRALKLLAVELDVPVIALAQLGRSAEKGKKDSTPKMTDLRESGAIEQDADIVAILHDKTKGTEEEKMYSNISAIDLMVVKHRQGPTKTIQLIFNKQYSHFENTKMSFKGEDDE